MGGFNLSLDRVGELAKAQHGEAFDAVGTAVAAMATDPGALFADGVLRSLRSIRETDPAQYARIRAQAKVAKVSVTELDRLTATVSVESGGGNMMFIKVEPWPESVNGARLLDDLTAALTLYVIADASTLRAAALWAVHTWVMDVIGVSPIANITAPEKRCGKSRMLEVLGKLVYRALTVSNIAPAALFRSIEAWQPTLLIDEVDSFLATHEEARGIINSGFDRAGAYVVRCVGDSHEPTKFSTWGAKALCGIGAIADTLSDRSITLRLRRKLPGESVRNLRHSDPADWGQLRSQIARWADDNRERIRSYRPTLIEGIHDRANDAWEPLLSIAEVAGGEWPDRARSTALTLHGVHDHGRSVGAELLADIREAFARKDKKRMFTVDLLEALTGEEESPWATWNRGGPMSATQLSTRLKEFDITSADKRVGNIVRKGFDLNQFTDAFVRYLPADPSADAATTLQPMQRKGCSDSNAATLGIIVAANNGLKAIAGTGCSVVASRDQDPENEKSDDADEVLF